MRRVRYVFSKMLTRAHDPLAFRTVQTFLDRMAEERERHHKAMAELEGMQEDILLTLGREHKAPRGLTVVVDTQHMQEHGVLFLVSKETEEVDEAGEKENVH